MKKEKTIKNDDFLSQVAAEEQETANAYTQNIPEDEIWTYKIDGLSAPHIGIPFKNAKRNKIIVIIILLISIAFSIFFSVLVVHSDLYSYKQLEDGSFELVKFSNDGTVSEIEVDFVIDSKTGEKDFSKPITSIAEYAFNCDEVVRSISIGKDVKSIDSKSIYSCWWIQNVTVDPENEYYCDIDGVLYNKDVTEVIFYPNDHDKYLREKMGYVGLLDDEEKEIEELFSATKRYDEEFFEKYNNEVRRYVIPSTVTKIGQLAFAYTNIVDIYIPEGVTEIGNMAFFKSDELRHIYSYISESTISDTTYHALDNMTQIYNSLPEGLKCIGSDAFNHLRNMDYVYIPSSVVSIGHHAFWDAVYKDKGEFSGICEINVALSKDDFDNVDTGDQWKPMFDNGLFPKSVDINYEAIREY